MPPETIITSTLNVLQGVPSSDSDVIPELTLLEALGTGGLIVTGIMVLLFAFGLVQYLWPLWRTSHAFKIATARLSANKGHRVPFPAQTRHLNALWSQFLSERSGTTVKVGDEEISTVDPEEIFTEQAVLDGYNRNMALTLAGVFTGLGILGTFIGLVGGLNSIGGTQQSQVMNSILDLLRGMSTAFYTSIAGIALSLLWLLLDRILLYGVHQRVGRFFLAAKKAFPVESADRLLHRLLAVEQEESAAIHHTNEILDDHGKLLEEQKALLQTLGTDLAVAFQDALNTSLGNQMAPLLQAVVDSIENLSTQMGDRQVEAMNRLVDTFQQRLSEQLHGQFEGLSESLQKAAEWQERVHHDLDQLLTRVGEATERQREVIERSTEACDLFDRSLEDLGKSHELLAASAGRIEDFSGRVAEQLDAIASRVSEHLEVTIASMMQNFERVGTTIDGMAEALVAAVERIDLQARGLEERIQQLDAQQEVYRTANEEIREHLAAHIDALTEQIQSLNGFWLHFRDDLSKVGDELRGSVTEFSVFTADKLKEIFARFDSEMATIVEHLGGTLAEVREVTEDLPAGVERLRGTLDGAVRGIAEVGQAIGELPRTMERVAELASGVERLRVSLDAATEPLGKLDGLNEAIGGATRRIGTSEQSIIRLQEQLETANSRLAAALARADQKVTAE